MFRLYYTFPPPLPHRMMFIQWGTVAISLTRRLYLNFSFKKWLCILFSSFILFLFNFICPKDVTDEYSSRTQTIYTQLYQLNWKTANCIHSRVDKRKCCLCQRYNLMDYPYYPCYRLSSVRHQHIHSQLCNGLPCQIKYPSSKKIITGI